MLMQVRAKFIFQIQILIKMPVGSEKNICYNYYRNRITAYVSVVSPFYYMWPQFIKDRNALILAKVDPNLCRHMASLGISDLGNDFAHVWLQNEVYKTIMTLINYTALNFSHIFWSVTLDIEDLIFDYGTTTCFYSTPRFENTNTNNSLP